MNKFGTLILTASVILTTTIFSVVPSSAKTIVKKPAVVQQTANAKVVIANSNENQNALVILPPGFEHREIVVADSAEYKKMLAENVELQKQVKVENDWKTQYVKETQKVQQDQASALLTERKKTNSIFGYFKWIEWIAGGGLITFIIGAIVICVFFPVAIPLVEEWLVSFVKAIIRIFSDFAEIVSDLLKKKIKK